MADAHDTAAGWSPQDFVDLDRDRLQSRPGAKWQRYGSGVLSMWVADMDFPIAPMARAAIERQLDTGDLGYPWATLRHEVSETFARRMSDHHGWDVDPGDVKVIDDVIQGLQSVLLTCTEPGDGILMQTPIYHPFLITQRDMGRVLIDNPWIRTEDSWELDLDGLRSTLAATPAKVFILCNPHNPTGRVFRRDELEALAEIVVEHDLLVISDEIHSDLIHPGHTHIPFASLGSEVSDRTVTLNATSKSFSLAALKMAVRHTTSDAIKEKLDSLPGHLIVGSNTFAMRASLACWNDGQEWLDAVMERITANRDLLHDLLAEHIPAIKFRKPEATYLCWLDCNALDLGGAQPADYFLENAKVALNDGNEFGTNGEGCCRMNIATSPEIITEAVEKMAASL